MRYIGDIHGKVHLYHEAIVGVKESIQVGDMGLGFGYPYQYEEHSKRMFETALNVNMTNHRFIRGNHDNPSFCKSSLHYINNGYVNENKHFFVNGAWSIDGPGCPWDSFRQEGLDWWRDEEESQLDLNLLIEEFADMKPKVMVSHEAPFSVTDIFFNPRMKYVSRTAKALEEMFKRHKPKRWLFGHWHRRRDQIIDNCRFICLEEGGYIDLD